MSLPFNRLFVDVSYTRTQRGSIGVTRTVRSLLKEFQQQTPSTGVVCFPVVVHGSGFRELTIPAGSLTRALPDKFSGKVTATLHRWAANVHVRRLALACLPLHWLHPIWRLYSRWTFNALSRHAPFVDFQSGDVLFMGDAAWHYEAWYAMQQARKRGVRIVTMIHDLIPLRYPEYTVPLITRVFEEWLVRTLRISDAVICNSQATKTDLLTYSSSQALGLPPIGHFRLGCDPVHGADMDSVRTEIKLFLAQPRAVFIAVGSFEPRKNYEWLLEVFEGLWAKGHDVCLLIAGRPTADGRTLIEKVKLHPEQGCRLLAVFDAEDAELELMYSQGRALLFPSLAEGFGLPLVEARTRGCPVIASDLPVFCELADEGVYLYERNSIAAFESVVLAHAASNQRDVVAPMSAFTWNASAKQCMEVLTGLLLDLTQSPRALPLAMVGRVPAQRSADLLSN